MSLIPIQENKLNWVVRVWKHICSSSWKQISNKMLFNQK